MFCGRCLLSQEDKPAPLSHEECYGSFRAYSPASCLAPPIHSPSRKQSEAPKTRIRSPVSPLPPKLLQNIQHPSQPPSYHCAYLSDFISSPLIIAHQSLATPAFSLLHRCAKISPCSGALYLLFPLPRMLFLQMSAELAPSHLVSP